MKNKKEKWDALDSILEKIWLMLEQGAAHSDDPFHYSVQNSRITKRNAK